MEQCLISFFNHRAFSNDTTPGFTLYTFFQSVDPDRFFRRADVHFIRLHYGVTAAFWKRHGRYDVTSGYRVYGGGIILSQGREDNEACVKRRSPVFTLRPAQGGPPDAEVFRARLTDSPAQTVVSRVQQPVSFRRERVLSVHPEDPLSVFRGP